MGELAEQAPDIEIAFAYPSGLALARRLIVAGTDADPEGEPIGAAAGIHVGADLNQQHGGADEIDTGQGLQQRQGVALLLQCFQKPGIEAGNARLDLLDMAHQFVKHEAVAGGQFPVQGIEDFRAAGLESATGKPEHLLRVLSGDDGLDHGARRLPMQVTDHDTETNPAVVKTLCR